MRPTAQSLALVLLLSAALPVVAQPTRAVPASVAAVTAVEPHPEIRAAIRALERAKGHLKSAAHDFGGHRVEALAAVDKAIEQLNLALKFDK